MRAVMFQEVAQWLEDNIAELNGLFEENRPPVMLILNYALLSGGGLTSDQFVDILSQKGNKEMSLIYEPGSVAEQMVNEAKSKAQTEIASRLIEKGMNDDEVSELTDLPINKIAELRKAVETD